MQGCERWFTVRGSSHSGSRRDSSLLRPPWLLPIPLAKLPENHDLQVLRVSLISMFISDIMGIGGEKAMKRIRLSEEICNGTLKSPTMMSLEPEKCIPHDTLSQQKFIGIARPHINSRKSGIQFTISYDYIALSLYAYVDIYIYIYICTISTSKYI